MKGEVISAMAQAVGRENVLTDAKDIEVYMYAGIPVQRSIPAVIRPGTTVEVQRIISLAARNNLSVYTISTGKNWGYGSANPVRDNNLILDLSRMNNILEVNTDLAYAVVQPGVTQQDLYDYLEENNTGLMMDPTGSGPYCSILGNSLERGYGITPYGDHFSFVCGMEVVLADGEILHTGFGHFENSRVSRVFKWGLGPYLDGIFTQSNFGIVTSLGIWLMPRPEHIEACYFSCDNEEDIYPLIGAVRCLLQNGVIRGSVNLAHRNRALTMVMQYPWEEMDGKTPLDEELAQELAKRYKVGAWNGICGLYGSKEEIRAAKKKIKKVFKGKVSRINFISRPLLQVMEKFPGPLSLVSGMNIREMVKVIKPSYGILAGKPSEVSLQSPYWRSRKKPPESNINPVADNCGLFWFAPVVPMTAEHAREFINIVHTTLAKHGFESCIMLSSVTDRCFDCNLPIFYDQEDKEETEKAEECYEEVFDICMKTGYVPYRVGVLSMEKIMESDDPFWDVIDKLKEALDPENILSPGRYSRYGGKEKEMDTAQINAE